MLSAEAFTNGIENVGRRFALSQAVVGSLLAAVGTALPETILPIVAIFLYGGESAKDIGIGAILGAPFMLATLAFFLVGLTVVIGALKKRRRFEVNIEAHSTKRDLLFFLPMYSVAVILPLIAGRSLSVLIVILLIGGYILYAYRTLKSESAGVEHPEGLYLSRAIGKLMRLTPGEQHPLLAILQIMASLALMLKGARMFVENLEHISTRFGIDPLLFALIIAPIATELPEKFNSVSWTWKGRDTLAIGNITGAMVFQSVFPVSVGLLFTEWKLTGMALLSAVLALLSALIVLTQITIKKRLSPISLLAGGCLYLAFAAVLILHKT